MPVKAILEIVLYVGIAAGLWFAADWLALKPRREAAHATALAETYRIERDALDTSLKTAKSELANAAENARLVATLTEKINELENRAPPAPVFRDRVVRGVCPVRAEGRDGNGVQPARDSAAAAPAIAGDASGRWAAQLRSELIAMKAHGATCDALNDKLDSIYARQK